jgi:hypothetical protein
METSVRVKILPRMALSETESAKATIEKEIKAAAAVLESKTDYVHLEDSLSILKAIGFRNSEVAVSAIIAFIDTIERRELTYAEEPVMVAMLKDYRTAETLLSKAIETLVVFRYWQTVRVLHSLIPLTNHTSERIRKKAESGLDLLSEYDLKIFYGSKENGGIGAAPQHLIIGELERLDAPSLQKYLPAVLELLENLLSPEMEGETWTYNALQLTRAGTPAQAGIPDIRNRSIELLKRIYSLVVDVKKKLHIVAVLTTATRSSGPTIADESREMFIRDARNVLGFFAQLAVSDDLEVVQKVEHNSYWIFYHAIHEDIKAFALQVEAEIATNTEYQIFRVLIGFDGMFGQWLEIKEREFNPRAIDEFRKSRANEFVMSVTDSNYPEWKARILRYAKVQSDDLATFPIFYYFLERLAIEKPDLVLILLVEESENLRPFLIPLFRGLWAGPRKEGFRKLLRLWIDEGRYLYAATKQFLSNPDVDLELLKKIFGRAVELEEVQPLREMISVVVSNHSKAKITLIDELMLPALEVLTKSGDANWIFDAWFRTEIDGVLEAVGERGIDLILSNLSGLRKIDYQAERILAVVGKRSPEKVFRLLLGRLRKDGHDGINDSSRFEPIPFELHSLREPFEKMAGLVVQAVRQQYDGNYGMLIHRGARLIKIIFPEFPLELEVELTKLVEKGGEGDFEFVLAVLRNYEGRPAIQAICKEIVKAIAPDSELRSDVAIALESTGVVSGEFGMAEAYERKKAEVEHWLQDTNERVRVFAKQYAADLQAMSDAERKRAQEQIDLRKFQYGEN